MTGKAYRGHFDFVKRDEICDLAADVGVTPSFPRPQVLATRIHTEERFDIVPLPKSIVAKHGFRPSVRPYIRSYLDHDEASRSISLSTKLESSYDFLSRKQELEIALLPVHTDSEHKLYNEFLRSKMFVSGKGQNFDKMAAAWSEKVHLERATLEADVEAKVPQLFYKLPEHLEKHHKKISEARATKITIDNHAQALATIESLRQTRSKVLPAVQMFPIEETACRSRHSVPIEIPADIATDHREFIRYCFT